MTDAARLLFHQWRAVATELAETTPPGSLERAAAIQFRDALHLLMRPVAAPDRIVRTAEPITLASLRATSIRIPDKHALPIDEALDPAVTPDPSARVSLLLTAFVALSCGVFAVTPEILAAFKRAAFADPDPTVRAWALHLLYPQRYPRPNAGERE